MPKIGKTEVGAAKPADKDFFVWDSEIKGFGLKVSPTGVKSFAFQYRTPEGRTRRATIGKYSETLTADQARRRAKEMRRTVEDGGDPLGEKQRKRASITVNKLLDLYLASARFEEKAATTRSIDTGRINRHLRPALGNCFVGTLTTETVRRAFAAIRDGDTADDVKTGNRGRAIVKGGEGTARMAVRLLRAVLRWAIEEGHASSNPAEGVSVGTDGTRDTIIENADDYARMFRALDTMQNEKRIRDAAADAIRVIALTGARRGEIAGLRWRHVDLKKGVLIIPPSEHKTGRKIGKPRIIGLPATAQAIIAKQPEGTADDFVFLPAKGGGAINLSKPWRDIRAEAKLPEGIGLHGLRHSLASSMAMGGAEAAEIMTALGHRQLSTAQRYIHWAQDARSGLAERAASVVSAGLAGSKGETAKKVVKIAEKPRRRAQ